MADSAELRDLENGVSLDPLFLYIPHIDENTPCLMLDNGLKKIALILRTITDFRYILRIFRTIKGGFQESSKIMKIVMNLVIDVVAVLPIPQTFMQATNRSDRLQQKMKFIIEPRIRSIISDYGLPDEMESRIKRAVKEKLEGDEDLTVENMFSILSLDLPNDLVHEIKQSFFVNKLQKIPKLKDKNNEGLKKISEHLEPVIYTKGSYIIRQGEPLEMLFFITQGIVLTYAKNKVRSGTTQHEKQEDGLYGKELITWAKNSSNKLSNLPISPITVRAHKKVEVFALKAADLQHVLANLPKSFCTIL